MCLIHRFVWLWKIIIIIFAISNRFHYPYKQAKLCDHAHYNYQLSYRWNIQLESACTSLLETPIIDRTCTLSSKFVLTCTVPTRFICSVKPINFVVSYIFTTTHYLQLKQRSSFLTYILSLPVYSQLKPPKLSYHVHQH